MIKKPSGEGERGKLIDGRTGVCHFGSSIGTQKFNFLHKNPTPKFILQDFMLATSATKTGENHQFCI